MNDPAFKTAAYAMSETTPPHLGQPTSPPQGWVLEGANLVVLLADGRKIRGPIVDQKRDYMFPATKSPVLVGKPTQKIQMAFVPATHIHDNKKLEVKPPAKHKAGK
jgi:hypothetical protein